MAAIQSDYRYTFVSSGLLELDVIDFHVEESLSTPYVLTLNLSSKRLTPIAVADMLDRSATLTLWQGKTPARYIHGIISRFEQGGSGHHLTRYHIKLVPAYARMSLTSHCRIFQQHNVPDIIQSILNENGIAEVEFHLHNNHVQRAYCVQYRETDQAFIERLAAEEGLIYYFEHTATGHQLIFTDESQATPGLGEVYYHSNRSNAATAPAMFNFHASEQIATGEVLQRDYNFKNPGYYLQHQRQAASYSDYRKYDYPGRYKTDAQGKPFNRIRLEYEQSEVDTATAQSDHLHLIPGYRIKLSEAPQPGRGQNWLVTAIKHYGQQPQSQGQEAVGSQGGSYYQNRLRLIPQTQPWRAQPETRPSIDGPQIAHIVGPEGEEIYCDEHGRVKVQFPWDLAGQKNEHSSCWIRVSQGWAGAGWGAMAIPRIGQEVIVDFLEGDPDQPIITGRTYHAANVPPYALPANKTRMSIKSKTHKGEGFNELRFEDENGQEELFIHAQKDQNNIVRLNETTQVGHNRTESIAKNEVIQIGANRQQVVGGYQITQTGNDILIQSLTGDISLGTATGSITLTEAGQVHIHGKSVNVVGTERIDLNPPGGATPPKHKPLDLKMDMPKVPGNHSGGGSIGAIEASTLGAVSLARLMQQLKVGLPALSSTAGIAVGWLVPTETGGGVTTYAVTDELRIRHAHDQALGHYERKVDGDWKPTAVTIYALRDEQHNVTGFEGLSEAEAKQLQAPYSHPAQAPLTTQPGGFESYQGEDYSTMENPATEAGMTGGPTGYPAETGVPVAGVMTSENSKEPIPGRVKPRIEDGNSREGWQHIDERHVTGNSPKGPGDLFAPGTTREQIEKAADTVVTKGVRISDPSDRIQSYEKRIRVNGKIDRVRAFVDSKDNNRVITIFPARSN